jgi:hypothetical protein
MKEASNAEEEMPEPIQDEDSEEEIHPKFRPTQLGFAASASMAGRSGATPILSLESATASYTHDKKKRKFSTCSRCGIEGCKGNAPNGVCIQDKPLEKHCNNCKHTLSICHHSRTEESRGICSRCKTCKDLLIKGSHECIDGWETISVYLEYCDRLSKWKEETSRRRREKDRERSSGKRDKRK